MIIFIHGADTFRSRQFLKDQVAKFKAARDPAGYNVVFADGKKETGEKIWNEILAAPFLAEKRMIVVENILANNDKELLGELIARVKDKKLPESNVIVFWQGEALSKVQEAKKMFDILAKEKYCYEFKSLSPAELKKWTAEEIKKRGGKISSAALEYLVLNVGEDMWRLSAVIDQLVAYTAGLDNSSGSSAKADEPPPLGKGRTIFRPHLDGVDVSPSAREWVGGVGEITLADVQLFLEEKVEDNIFGLCEAVAAGNAKLALKLLYAQRAFGSEEPQIFGMIVRQFRILIQIADLLNQPELTTSEAMAKVLGLHPFVVKKSLPLARRYSLADLKKVYRALLEVDIKTKTGQGEQSFLIDMFVAQIGR